MFQLSVGTGLIHKARMHTPGFNVDDPPLLPHTRVRCYPGRKLAIPETRIKRGHYMNAGSKTREFTLPPHERSCASKARTLR